MNEVLKALSQLRINPINEEYDLQNEIARVLNTSQIDFIREYRLGKRNRVDFRIGSVYDSSGVVIEVKKGKPNKRKVVEQLSRYANFPEVTGIILVVEKNLDVPKEINGKPCISFGLNKLWGIAL